MGLLFLLLVRCQRSRECEMSIELLWKVDDAQLNEMSIIRYESVFVDCATRRQMAGM